MKKTTRKKPADELVTRGILQSTLGKQFSKHRLEWKQELQSEIHALEYRMTNQMEATFGALTKEMREYRETFQVLADKVIGVYKNLAPTSNVLLCTHGI